MTTETLLPQSQLHRVDRVNAVLEETYGRGQAESDAGESLSIATAGMRREQGEAIAQLVAAVGGTKTIETGFAFGLSGLFMLKGALGASRAGAPGKVEHTAIDPFQRSNWGNAGLRLFEQAGVADALNFRLDRSEFVLPDLAKSGPSFHVGLVDGDHRYDTTFTDVFYMCRLVVPGGLILVDDTWMPSVTSVVNFFVKNGVLECERQAQADTGHQMAILRVPNRPDTRSWDHFVDFDTTPIDRL